jgi:EF-hand domain pair
MTGRQGLAALVVLMLGATVFAAAPKKAPPVKASTIDAQLQAVFNKADQNGDGYLDAVELAHSFRGASAKLPPSAYDDKGNLTPAAQQARTKYPDMVYLLAVDKDGDGRIGWDEFKTFGENSAKAMQQQQKAIQAAYQRAMQNMRNSQRRGGSYGRGPSRSTNNRGRNNSAQQRAAQAARARQQQAARARQAAQRRLQQQRKR